MNNRKKSINIAIVCICIIMAILYMCLTYFSSHPKVEEEWKKSGKEAWKITQYGDPNVTQMMFYTIESSDGKLMIIDGGWRSNAEKVREVIQSHGNHVDAWILTHPHPDHIGAFIEVMKSPETIQVDMVYGCFIDFDSYESVATEYDNIEIYQEYWLMALKGTFPVTHINRDEIFQAIGLNIACFNSYDGTVEERTDDLCNNSSLMLKMCGNEEAFLFCADVEKDMQDYLIEEYKNVLQADYVQMAHHGNWGLYEEFYQYVNPKVAFFDGNSQLYEKDTTYDGWKMLQYMEQQGVIIYTLETSPNSIIMH